MKLILVTGGSGFIGSNFVLDWLSQEQEPIIVLDKLTYAGNISNLNNAHNNPRFTFVKGDINDKTLVEMLLKKHSVRAILNFAAESHVDRSIHKPDEFINTNIHGTFNLLETARQFLLKKTDAEKLNFRFLQISTDEVYGSLKKDDAPFTETSAYLPNNPYSASKAAADHLVKAYYSTYGLPTLITNCSNNYGPYQYPEKLIPLTIINALQSKPLLVYGDGLQIRDWLYVTDHCTAIRKILTEGKIGDTYNIGGNCERTNLEVVQSICSRLDKLKPHPSLATYGTLITHIKDRPGHDRRYAIDPSKTQQEIGWTATESFESGLQKTILWYLANSSWINKINNSTNYDEWLEINYKERS